MIMMGKSIRQMWVNIPFFSTNGSFVETATSFFEAVIASPLSPFVSIYCHDNSFRKHAHAIYRDFLFFKNWKFSAENF